MKKQLLVIYDLDKNYGEGLFSYLKKSGDFPFEVKLITGLESLSEKEEVEVLLMDQSLEGMKLTGNIKNVLYLSEEQNDSKHIERYQSVDRIIEHIRRLSTVPIESEEHNNIIGKTGLIGVYSPVGGCGKSALAKEIAAYIGMNGRHVYYLDFELIPNEVAEKRAGFFYELHERTLYENDWNQYFTEKEDIHYLITSIYHSELWELNEQDIEYLIEGIREMEEDAYYIFDIGFLNQSMFRLLKECDYWVLPYTESVKESTKVCNLKEVITFRGENGLLDKLVEVSVEQGHDEIIKKLVL